MEVRTAERKNLLSPVSSTVLFSHANQSIDVVLSGPTSITEELHQKVRLSYPPDFMADPIDGPGPH